MSADQTVEVIVTSGFTTTEGAWCAEPYPVRIPKQVADAFAALGEKAPFRLVEDAPKPARKAPAKKKPAAKSGASKKAD